MKHLIIAALLTALLAGCAETPSQEASIEDRSVASKDASTAVDAKAGGVSTEAATTGARTQPDANAPKIESAAIESAPAPVPSEKVETHGVAAPVTQVKSLDGTPADAIGADGKPAAATGETGSAGTSGTVSEGAKMAGGYPVPVAKDPTSPLAQRRILFDFDSSAIRDEYRGVLEAHAQFLIKEKSAKVILQGNTDERGSREYNLALGQRRAESVFKALNLLGVPDTQIEAVSLGEEKPVAEGHDEAAWKQNRRTEILYLGE